MVVSNKWGNYESLCKLKNDFSVSALVAGFLVAFVSYAGPLAIVFQAAKAAHLSTEVTSSWVFSISIGSGITGIILSWRNKIPIITAWSTSCAVLLITILPNITFSQAIGAYIATAICIIALGLTGLLDKFIQHIPKGMGAGMLAGILFQFVTHIFSEISINPTLVLLMISTFLVVKRWHARYAIASVMLVGVLFSIFTGHSDLSQVRLSAAHFIFVAPQWSWHSMIDLVLPMILLIVTGQYLPGMAVMYTSGYKKVPIKQIATVTGIASIFLACFGSPGITLSAITAAICTGKEAHEDPHKRYIAGIFAGFFYIVAGVLSATVALLFASLPQALIGTLAGLALISAVTSCMVGIVNDAKHRDASVITFFTTASGMSFLGLGSPFWGLVIGGISYLVLHKSFKIPSLLNKKRTPISLIDK